MSYTFQVRDISKPGRISVFGTKRQPKASSSSPADETGSPLMMWLVPVVCGLALLAVAAVWFSMLGTFYSAGAGNDGDLIGTVVSLF